MDVVEIYELMESNGIMLWIDGGWGVDALLGKQTRVHNDLDVAVQAKDVPKMRELLASRRFREKGEDYTRPFNYILIDDVGRELDLHIIELDAEGNGIYGGDGGESFTAHALSGRGTICGREVHCIAAEDVVRFHAGYDLKEKDFQDVSAVCEAFGIELPAEYQPFLTPMAKPDVELIGGKERVPVKIVSYDEAWPARFDAERQRIKGALGGRAVRVEHVGSTSVPGLSAKPIVDIQVSVRDVEDDSVYVPSLEAAGYALRVREPGHRMVRTPERDVHIHLCAAGSDWERRHILFRDWLRHDQGDRELYQSVKLELAERDWPTMNHYADAKSTVIADITARAERWARNGGRTS